VENASRRLVSDPRLWQLLRKKEARRGELQSPEKWNWGGRIMDWRAQWGSLWADRQLCWLQFSKCSQAFLPLSWNWDERM